jgi:hypothetical protein
MNYKTLPNKQKLEKEKIEQAKQVKQEKVDERYNIMKHAINLGNTRELIIENFKQNSKYWILLLYVILIIYVFWTAYNNPTTLFSQKYVYIMTILVPLFLMVYIFANGSQFMTSLNFQIALGILVVIVITYALVYYIKPRGIGFQIFAGYGFNILLFFIIIVGLAIIFNVFRNSAKKLTGWTGFFVRLFFFIPCLLSDYLDYLKSEYQSTPPVVFMLLIAEILLILAYIYIPKIMNRHLIKNSTVIQRSPLRLDIATNLSNNTIFRVNPKDILVTTDKVQDKTTLLGKNSNVITTMMDASGNLVNTGIADTYTSNFGLSMWIYVNEKDVGVNQLEYKNMVTFKNVREEKIINNRKVSGKIKRIRKEEKKLTPPYEIPIFKYGNPNTNGNKGSLGKPSITYLGNSQWKFNLTVPSNPDIENNTTYFIMSVPSQKWNNVVFNYYDNKVDLWINGNLERNMDLQENPLNHRQSDVITVGSKSGLMGALCNLQFFSKPMTATQITQSYNLLYSQNPPLNNLP